MEHDLEYEIIFQFIIEFAIDDDEVLNEHIIDAHELQTLDDEVVELFDDIDEIDEVDL